MHNYGERVSGVTYVTWTGVIKTVRLWVGVTYVTWTGVSRSSPKGS